MPDPSKNLIAAIDDLLRRRQEIDDAIVSMQTVLANIYHVADTLNLTDSVSVTVAPTTVTPPTVRVTPGPASRAERVRRVFREYPNGVWTSESLAEAIGEEPDERTIKTIHGILSRLRKAGDIDNIGRGEYRAASEDASAPAATGAEEGEESTSDSSRETGGTEYGSALPEDRGDGAAGPLVIHDLGDRRAAIEAAR